MRLALAMLFVCLGISGPAFAADRTETGTCNWSAVNAGCFGAAGAQTDNFTVGLGGNVTVTASFNLTSGSVIVANGGTLTVNPGVVFGFGDGSGAGGAQATSGLEIQQGGTLNQNGTLLHTCRITTQPDWSAGVAATHKVSAQVVDCDLSDVSTSTDYVFFGDEDPTDLDAVLTHKCVAVGPGTAQAGCYRPAFNKWASYKIIGATGTTLTWDIDEAIGNYTASPNAPYAGSRYVPAAGAVAGNTITYATRWLKRRSTAQIPVAYSADVCTIRSDRGAWYLQYDEIAGHENDADVCSGMTAKILGCTNGGAGDDTIEVEGDVSGCTSALAQARITLGARRGDLVYIYRPATLDGNTDGDYIGEGGIVFGGGHWNAHWARIVRTFGVPGGNFAPASGRAGNINFIQGAAGTDQPIADWNWVDIAFFAFTPGSDSGVLEFTSETGVDEIRYPLVGILDMTPSRFRHINVHDAINNAVNGGTHGIYSDGSKGLETDQVRVERINDDCIGSTWSQTNGANTDRNSWTIKHALVYECLAETDNSQEGIQFQNADNDDGKVDSATLAARAQVIVQDANIIGVYGSELESPFTNGIFKGITTGGVFRTGAVSPVLVRWSDTGDSGSLADTSDGPALKYGSNIYDSNLYVMDPGTTSTSPISVVGVVHDSFIGGFDSSALTGAAPQASGLDSTVVDNGASSDSSGYMFDGAAAKAAWVVRRINVSNSVLRSTKVNAGFLANVHGGLTLSGLQNYLYRTILLEDSLQISAPGITNNFATGTNITNSTTTIDGLFATSVGATTAAFIAQSGTGNTVTVNHACLEGSNSTGVFGGLDANGTTRIISAALSPNATDSTLVLRDLVTNAPASTGCVAGNYPTHLGYRNFRVSHAMLGDFEIQNYARSSSDEIIRFTPITSCGGRWPECN